MVCRVSGGGGGGGQKKSLRTPRGGASKKCTGKSNY